MQLDKWNGCFQCLFGLCLMFYNNFFTILVCYLKVHIGFNVRRSPKYQTNNKSDGYLSDNLIFTLQSFLVMFEYLNEIIHSTEEAQPNGCDNHQQKINVTQST